MNRKGKLKDTSHTKRGKSKFAKLKSNEPRNYQDLFAESEKEKGEREKFTKGKVRVDRNDPQWYFKDQQILKDVASFSYSKPLGAPLRMDQVVPPYGTTKPGVLCNSVPGVMGIRICLTPGVSENAQSPLNLAAQNIYSYIRKDNSGAKNYDPTDLMMYLLAMDSLYSAWNWMKRIYGYASTYSQTNYYKPRAYAALDFVDIEDVFANLADFRAYLNMAAYRISAFCCPAVMALNIRHSWMFSGIFKDAETIKAQEYMYVPNYFYKFDEVSTTTGTSLSIFNVHLGRWFQTDSTDNETTIWTVPRLKWMLDTLINSMQYSEDVGTMSGDILKAYGESGLFKLSSFDADYRVDAMYSKEVLSQIENARITPLGEGLFYDVTTATKTELTIKQDPNTNFIKFKPTIPINRHSRNGAFLNFHWNDPTPEDVIVATRLQHTYDVATTGDKVTLTSVGTELATDMCVTVFAEGYDTNTQTTNSNKLSLIEWRIIDNYSVSFDKTQDKVSQSLVSLWMWSAFDWAPELHMQYANAVTTGKDIYLPPYRDWDNFTYLANEKDRKSVV